VTKRDTGHNIIPVTWLSYLPEWWRSGGYSLYYLEYCYKLYHLYHIIYINYTIYINYINFFFLLIERILLQTISTISSTISSISYHLLYQLLFLTYRENINSDTGHIPRYRSQYYTGDMAVLFGCPICRSGGGVVDILSIT